MKKDKNKKGEAKPKKSKGRFLLLFLLLIAAGVVYVQFYVPSIDMVGMVYSLAGKKKGTESAKTSLKTAQKPSSMGKVVKKITPPGGKSDVKTRPKGKRLDSANCIPECK